MTQSEHGNVQAAPPSSSCPSTPETALAQQSREAPDYSQKLTDLRITHHGHHYYFNGYRYDRLPDAIAYAELMKARPSQVDAGGPNLQDSGAPPSTDADLALMARLGITYSNGVYFLGEFRYDHLADALDFANRMQGRVDAP